MNLINLYLVQQFPSKTTESNFLLSYRKGSLLYLQIACALSMFMAVVFIAAEALLAGSMLNHPGQMIRTCQFLIEIFAWILIVRKTDWLLKHYVFCCSIFIFTLLTGVAAGILTHASDNTAYMAGIRTAAFTIAIFLVYGYCRLPCGAALLICSLCSFILLGSAWFVTSNFDVIVRMSVSLLVANAAGLSLTVLAEKRERKLFATQLALEHYSMQSESEARIAKEATQAKTRVLSAVAHDLRQPMMGLMARADMLINKPGATTLHDLHDHLQALQTTVSAMDGHLQTLLDLSQTQLSDEPFEVQSHQIGLVLVRIREVFLEAARQHGVQLRVRVPRARCWGQINAPRLFDLLSQLVWNAVKYARLEHNARPRVFVGVKRTSGDRWRIVIADNGIGMNENVRARMFDEYFQGHISERSRRLGGYGLGMSQVRALLRRLPQHDLSVRSELGRGTYFALGLPHCAQPPEQNQVSVDANSLEKADLTALRGRYVLLVDDRPDVCSALELALESIGLLVGAAINFNSALQIYACAERDFDLVLTDYELDEGHTGAELIRTLRSQGCEAPTLLITSNPANTATDEQALFTETLIKPLTVNQLAAACLRAIRTSAEKLQQCD